MPPRLQQSTLRGWCHNGEGSSCCDDILFVGAAPDDQEHADVGAVADMVHGLHYVYLMRKRLRRARPSRKSSGAPNNVCVTPIFATRDISPTAWAALAMSWMIGTTGRIFPKLIAIACGIASRLRAARQTSPRSAVITANRQGDLRGY